MPSLLPSALLLLALSAHCCSLYSPGLATTPHLDRWRQQHRRPRAVTSQQPPALLTARGGPRVALDEGSPAPGEEGQSSGNNEPVDGGGGEDVGGSSAATTLDPGRPLRPTTPLFSRATESGDRTPPPHFDRGNDTDANRNSSRDGSSEEGSSWTRPLACSALPAFTFLLLWGLFNCAIFTRRGVVAPAAAADRLRCFAATANALLLAFAGLRVALTALVLSSAELQGLIASSLPPQLRGGSGGFSAAGFAVLVAAVSLHELALPCLATAFSALLLHFVPPAAAARKPCPLPSSPSSSFSLSLISSSLPSPASGRARGALLAVVFSTHLCVAALACLAFAMRPAKAVFLLAVPRGFLVVWGLALAGVCLATAACGPVGGTGRSDRRQASTAIRACFAGSSCLLMLACCLHGAEAIFTVLGVGAGTGVGPPLLAARLVCELCAALALCAASSLWLRRGPRAGFTATAAASSSRRWQQQDEAEMTDEARKRRAKRNGRHSAPLKHADVKGASYDSVRPALAGEVQELAPDPPSPRCVANGATLGSTVRFSVGDERVQLLQGNGEEEVDDEVECSSGGTSGSSASRAYSWRDASLAAAIGSEEDNQSSLREFTQRPRYGNFAGGGGGGGGDYDVPSGAFRAGDFILAASAPSWDDFIRPPSPINLQGSIDDALWRRSLIVRSLFEEEEEDDDNDNEKQVARNAGEDG